MLREHFVRKLLLQEETPNRRQAKRAMAGQPTGSKSGRVSDANDRPQTAVAIHYDPSNELSAPKVVASGRGHIADKILEVAFAHGVKVRKDADLAEILAAVDIDEEIPVEAFIAVAEIMRYLYAANSRQPSEFQNS